MCSGGVSRARRASVNASGVKQAEHESSMWRPPRVLQAMAMALPVISTNWSGLTAFMTDAVAYPIRIEGVVDVKDAGPNSFEWFQGQRWVVGVALHNGK
jgi:hypothetical protein